ncbi:MAG: ferritin [Gemmatimonadota bacterium]|nr:MAG: ferritin [Gemmatimonadota bacterium]
MASTAVVKAINDQIAMEFKAAYTYLSMSAYFENKNLPGFARWMRMQYEEELAHALRLFDFLTDLGARVELQQIPQPPADYDSTLAAFQAALQHEQKVTASINKIYDLAVKESHYPTQLQMQWFVNEQVEEEKSVGDVISQLQLVGDNGPALLMLDKQLGGRTGEGGEGP